LPDYIGLGVSHLPQPYLITQPQVDASIDMLRAVKQISLQRRFQWSSNLLMMGFSQGGQVVAGIHRELEQHPLPGYNLKGSIGIAGPYDLRKTSLPKALETNCRQCTGYLAWGTYSYASYYCAPLRSALSAEYAELVPDLFDGSKSAQEIGAALPDDPNNIFQPEFLNALRTNTDNWFTKALDSNETYRWIPVAPFRIYYGDEDKDVTPLSSKAFFKFAKPRGGNVSLHSLGPVDHPASAAMTYAPALMWFDQLVWKQ
jgi:hypothetical protein